MIIKVDLKRRYDKWFINPRSIDMSGDIELNTNKLKLDCFVKAIKEDYLKLQKEEENEKEIPTDFNILFNEVLFDSNDENWGAFYPRYECIVDFDKKEIIKLIPIDFEEIIKLPYERRTQINFEIAGGLVMESELKGIRKFIEGFIFDNNLQDKTYAKTFLNNNNFIRKVIKNNPKKTRNNK